MFFLDLGTKRIKYRYCLTGEVEKYLVLGYFSDTLAVLIIDTQHYLVNE